MARDLSAYLQDIPDACNSTEDVMSGISLEDYRNKRAVRSAIEREFIIIGKALRRVSFLDETLFSSISNSRAIVDFRNLLAHDYGAIDDDAVFGLVYSDLIVLKAEVGELLDSWHDAN
ncbi:DUF86 domain-containing protein [Cyanobium sp. WAJ14-Wanaka]|uniref:HepT-like ribonuclease domain-containing protein n=1 Tax=Cyanobium sp. WAJ14-Wanaka TaxID=2823725 RepID=UPI0020CF4BE2|nr:HepT-like ribonuclease domain-containing protein [Cyanobium sp. WAJ14-Wanaka]MCP9776149.1 DUF86 domain-containing protein [Cyanobium sp. WAJ14-Wanaka]